MDLIADNHGTRCISSLRNHGKQHTRSVTVPLIRPSADAQVIIGTAVPAVQGMYRPSHDCAEAGVILIELHLEGQRQGELGMFNRRFWRGTVNVSSAARRPSGPER